MEELLDRISQEGLLVVCIALAAVALLLAIVIVVEIIVSKKKASYEVIEDAPSKENNKLNIKYDENITYVDENSEEERRKAKAELEHIKNKLIEEDNKKHMEEEKKTEVALKVENDSKEEDKVNIPEVEITDGLEGTKEYKVFSVDEKPSKEEVKEEVIDKKDELYNTIDNMLDNKVEVEPEIVEEKPVINDKIDVRNMNIVYPTSFNNISSLNTKKEEIIEPVKEEIIEEPKVEPIVEPVIEEAKEEIVEEPIQEDFEPIVIESIEDSYKAKRDVVPEIVPVEPTIEETPQVEPVTIQNEVVEEPIVEEPTQKIDNATKERIIDEYLKQAILTRINEEKEKQLKIKEQIEQERKVLLFDDNNLEIIDSGESFVPETPKSTIEEKVEDKINILDQMETEIREDNNNSTVEVEEDKKSSVYEELEEENAIISYDELLKATKFGYTDEEMNNYIDEKDAIISIDELDNLYKEVNDIAKKDNRLDFSNVEFKKVEDLPKISDEKKFKKSDIISPVYGINNNKKNTDIELEETLNLNKLSEEIKKTNEFLSTLKDLQKNLD